MDPHTNDAWEGKPLVSVEPTIVDQATDAARSTMKEPRTLARGSFISRSTPAAKAAATSS